MSAKTWERWGAVSGLVSLAAGAAGGALERGWPSARDPAAVEAFVAHHRTAILAQSMLFVVSAGIFLWFLGSLRAFLAHAEGASGETSTVAMAAGSIWAGMSMVAQAFQVGSATAPGAAQPALLSTMAATFTIANLPLAVMLVTVGIVSLRHRAFPVWHGWLSFGAAAAQLLLFLGTVIPKGPLSPAGWLASALYPFFALWLVPTAVMMMRGHRDATVHPIRRRHLALV